MRLGLSTPVVVQQPGVASPWEAGAGRSELVRVVREAERLGFDHVTCSEHLVVPTGAAAEGRGTTYWHPLATLSYLAAHTSRIRLATSVVVLGLHHPLELAKAYGTLDVLSGGRVVLGVGVGSLREEFDRLGASFDDRGARADEALVALRTAWGRREVDGLVVEPHATRREPVLWVGGRTSRSLRRAVELGTGWMPFGLRPDELGRMLAAVERPTGFEVVLSPHRPLDPEGDRDGVRRRLLTLVDAGATILTCAVSAGSVAHYCQQLACLQALAHEIGPAS